MAKEKKNVKKDNNRFMKDFKAELKKVTWPTSKQMVSDVTAVIVIVLVTFGAANKYGVEKLKENVQANKVQENVTDNATDAQNTENTENAENTANDATEEEQNETTETVENNDTANNVEDTENSNNNDASSNQ